MKLLNEEEASHLLGVSRQVLAGWRHRHVGPPYVRLETRVMYNRAALEAYLRAHTVTPDRRPDQLYHPAGRRAIRKQAVGA